MEETTSFETLSYDVADGVAHLRFTRPEGANAVNPTFSRELRKVMLAIEFDRSVRAVAVTAEGKVFCAGGDLKTFHEAGERVPHLAADMLVDFHGAIYKMNRMAKPFVAGVRGAAGGAGLSLMSAFDLVISGRSAKYTMAYTRAGVTPDGTSSYFLARHIGLRRMLDLTLTNRVLSADEAEQWGLVNRVVPDDEVDQATLDLARELASGPWANGPAKRVIYEGFESPLERAGEYEAAAIFAAMSTHDGQEGIAAFAQKRKPEFRGD
jgi:2-(1,2-epoxy-1,2-dihydrophenyl)acetyl-CoA isomerase